MSVQILLDLHLPISCYSWNADKTQIALCPGNNEIWIYQTSSGVGKASWKKTYTLKKHESIITGIDWNANTNKIVTCSHDANAFVWSFVNGNWIPEASRLKITKGATQVKWSPDGHRFAVASVCKCISFCVYEPLTHLWIGKVISDQINTAVLCLEFHPTAHILAVGTMDGLVLLYSTFTKKIKEDSEYKPGPLNVTNEKLGTLLKVLNYTPNVWINSLSWSQQGTQLCYSSQNSCLNIVYFSSNDNEPSYWNIKLPSLSCLSTCFLSDYTIACAGYDNTCYLIGFNGEAWNYIQPFETEQKKTTDSSNNAGARGSRLQASLKMFESLSQSKQTPPSGGTPTTGGLSNDNSWKTHKNTITCIEGKKIEKGSFIEFSTSGLDGKVCVWSTHSLPADVQTKFYID